MGLPDYPILRGQEYKSFLLLSTSSRGAGGSLFQTLWCLKILRVLKRLTIMELQARNRRNFGPRPDFNSPDYDFDKELARLPFPLKSGESPICPRINR